MASLTLGSHSTPSTIEPRGYVHAAGDFVREHGPEVHVVMRNEARRARRQSSCGRIIGWDDDGSGGLLVSTSTEHLAHRLGRALQKELGGELHHGFNVHSTLALVWWRR